MRRKPYPAGWRCRGAGGSGRDEAVERASDVVRVRFVPSGVPVLTCAPPDRAAALRGAAETLARLGRSDLGGHLQVSVGGPEPAEHLAAARAVENALRGGCGIVQVPPPRWPGTHPTDHERRHHPGPGQGIPRQ